MKEKYIKLICKNVIENNNSYIYYFANALGDKLDYPSDGKVILSINYNGICYMNEYELISDIDDAIDNVYKIIITNENDFSNLFINNIDINSFVDCILY